MKEITGEEIEALEDYLEFTPEQKKAITNLRRAFTKCGKLGLEFWDNYGSLTAYDTKKMTCPVPDDQYDFNYQQGGSEIDCCKDIREAGDTSGNADDTCQFSLRRTTLKQIMKDWEESEE